MIGKCKPCEYWYLILKPNLIQVKSQRKASGCPHMISMSFIGKMHKLIQVRNRCHWCMNKVIKLYHYWVDLFSVFRLWPHFALLMTVYRWLLNKQCACINRFTSGFRCRWAVPGGRQKQGMALVAIMQFWWRGSWAVDCPTIIMSRLQASLLLMAFILCWWSCCCFRSYCCERSWYLLSSLLLLVAGTTIVAYVTAVACIKTVAGILAVAGVL